MGKGNSGGNKNGGNNNEKCFYILGRPFNFKGGDDENICKTQLSMYSALIDLKKKISDYYLNKNYSFLNKNEEFVANKYSKKITKNREYDFTIKPDGSVTVLVYNIKNKDINGNNNEIMEIYLLPGEEITIRDYNFHFQNPTAGLFVECSVETMGTSNINDKAKIDINNSAIERVTEDIKQTIKDFGHNDLNGNNNKTPQV